MSKLDELIKELCPDGVEYKKFEEVAKIQRGASPRPITNFISDNENDIPWIKIGDTTPNSKYVNHTKQRITKEGATKSRLLKKGDFIISNSMSFGRPYILNIDGAIHDGWASISDFENEVNSDFLYHFLSSELVHNYWISKINSGSVSNLNVDIIKSLEIPVPPLPIQHEIARILDTFAELTKELTTELETELTARKQQHEYYQRISLSFNDEIPYMKLGEICDLTSGGDVPKEHWNKEKTEEYTIPIYSNGVENDGLYGYTNNPRITKPSVTIAGRGAGVGNAILRKEPYFPIIRLVSATPKSMLNVDYLYHCIKLIEFKIPQSGIPQLTVPMVSSYEIPVPEINKQKEIANKLNVFEKLINDITKGLPAEIEQRQKQYEYYRDKLLNFC